MSLPLIWIIVGIVLVIAEFAFPGLIVVFFGFAAIFVGLALYAGLPDGNGIPFIVFSTLSLMQVFFLRRCFKTWFLGASFENADELEEFIGHEAVVVSGFEDGAIRGRVEFKGTNWAARLERASDTLKAGDRVHITGRKGLHLTISL